MQQRSGETATALANSLLAEDLVDRLALDRALALSKGEGIDLDRALLRLGLVEETDLLRHLAATLGVPMIADPSFLSLDTAAAASLSLRYLLLHTVAPVESEDGVSLLTSDPGNQAVLEEVAFHLERPLAPIAAPRHAIRRLLEASAAENSEGPSLSADQASRDKASWSAGEADGPVIKFVSDRLHEAVARGASDIHFSSADSGLSVRLRINGVLVPLRIGPDVTASAVFARLKVLAGMNVAERRHPQDGRMTAVIGGRVIDFRVSALPTQQGESVVCRLLDPRSLRLGWDKLGFGAEIESKVRQVLDQPNGLFLVTGPTGSGKTTTLYTALSYLNTPKRKIITIEDPVEYQIAGIDQVQVHEEIGLTFATVLRSVLRQDPNVIMVGEIRDPETAEMACRAALVGRLVLSTLHTNSAEGAVTRLVDLGVDSFIVKDVVRAVLGQELVIAPCPSCDASGCDHCGGTGSAGRRLVADLRLYDGR